MFRHTVVFRFMNNSRFGIGIAIALLGALAPLASGFDEGPRSQRLLSVGWKFHQNDAPGAEALGFDDGKWLTVSVPHDWSIEGAHDKANAIAHAEFTKWVVWRKDGSQSYLPRGTGWYRLNFNQPALGEDKKALVYFEGVYRESDVWLNGKLLGHHPSGYTSFSYDITGALKPGRNVLAVRCDTALKEGWWFEACGIYRPVQLLVTDKLSIPPWGLWVSTPEITAEKALARVCTTVRNDYAESRKAVVRARIVDAAGTEIGSAKTMETVEPGKSREVTQEIAVASPRLWSPDEPYLYRTITEVGVGEKVTDATETAFGIRAFHFDPELGFFLNGKALKLWGVANHMDIASLGGALPPRVCYENTRVLKGSGANFLRGAHNARTPAELDATDRLGICVVDETRYFDNSEFGLSSLRDMILRDRNHPSVIIWSLGNEEEGKQGTPAGVAIAKDLIKVVREIDPYRATSIAQNRDFNKPCGFSDLFDVLGQNWRGQDDAFEDHRLFPKRAVYVSEYGYSGSGWDRYASWPWLAGAATWGGFEYYGELAWPNKTWPGQIADLCHDPLEGYYRARAQWGNQPTLWIDNTWKGEPGRNVELKGATNCEEVRAYVDGKLAQTVLKDLKRVDQLQHWLLKPQQGGKVMILSADGRALQNTDLKLAAANPSEITQLWDMLEKSADGVAFSTGNGRVLNVNGNGSGDGAEVMLYSSEGDAPNERWKVNRGSDGTVRVLGYSNGKCLTLASPEGGLMLYAGSKALNSAGARAFVSTGESELKMTIPFKEEGVVTFEGLIAGKVVAKQELRPLGKPVRLVLESKTASLRNDGADVAILRCGIADAAGNIIRDADRKVRITVQGAGAFAGSGNACRDLTKTGNDPVTSPETTAYRGLCQFVVRAGEKPGDLVARVEADGLEAAQVKIAVTPKADPTSVDVRAEGVRLPKEQGKEGFVLHKLDLSTNNVASNEIVQARIELENGSSAYPIEAVTKVDGLEVNREKFSVPLGGTRAFSIPLPKFYAQGDHSVEIALLRNGREVALRTMSVTVRPTPVAFAAEKLEATPYVSQGGVVKVVATVRNIGSVKAESTTVPVLLNGKSVAESKVSVPAGGTAEIEVSFAAPSGELHEVRVADATASVTILKPFKPGEGLKIVGSPAQVSGNVANALKFSGSNEFIKIAPIDLAQKSFTIWIRCKLDALDPASKMGFLFSGGQPGNQTGIGAGFRDERLFFSATGDSDLHAGQKVLPGRWVDLAFVMEAKYTPKQTGPGGVDLQAAYWSARRRIYVDGKQDGDRECKVYQGDLSRIAADWGGNQGFNGVIESVKVFGSALTQEQISQLGAGEVLSIKPAFWLQP